MGRHCSGANTSSQEIASRHTRLDPFDRNHISEKTAKSLRLQAARPRIHRECIPAPSGLNRSSSSGRITPLVDVQHSEEDEGSEFEGFEMGVSALYDAYRRAAEPVVHGEGEPSNSSPGPIERVTSPRPPPWASSAGPSNARRTAIRQLARQRTLDFSDFTTRRRHAQRSNSDSASGDPRYEVAADGSVRFSDPSIPPTARVRYRPISSTMADSGFRVEGDGAGPSGEQRASAAPFYPYSLYAPPSAPHSGVSPLPPRLRRGGLRAPELQYPYMHSLADVPTEEGASPGSVAGDGNAPAPSGTAEPSLPRSSRIRQRTADVEDGTHQLLTPRSISPSEENNA